MGEVYQYYITMLVTREKEDAIKDLFSDKNWTCLMNVISEQTLEDVKKSGYDYIFTDVFGDYESNEKTEFVEIKSEIVNVDYAMDTDTDGEVSDVSIETPIDSDENVEEIEPVNSSLDIDTSETYIGNQSENNCFETSGASVASDKIPSISYDSINHDEVPDSADIPSVAPVASMASDSGIIPENGIVSGVDSTVLPASGHMTDLMPQNIFTHSQMNRSRRNNVRYTNVTKNDLKHGYLGDDMAEIKSSSQERLQEKVVKEKIVNVKKMDTKLIDGKRKVKPKSKRYSQQQGLSSCPDCHEQFPSLETLWDHRNQVQHPLPTTKPQGFDKRYYSPDELVKMDFQKCPECDYYFQDRRKLRQHLFACHREIMPNPVCQICGKEFQSYKDLHKHKREEQHMDSIWRLNSYQCETCGKHITKYENFKRHKELSCGKSEAELAVLRVHPCEICGKLFTTKKSASQHVAVVHNQEEAVCDVCGKVCKTKFALRSHKRRHFETNRKHVCEECGKGFFSVAILKQHQRVHTKEKPFKCPLCEYTSSLAGNIKKHSHNVHKQKVTPVDLRDLNKNVV